MSEQSESTRAAYLVLGMHRSGTSAAAGLLDILGVPTPGELLPPQPDNPKGFFENKAVYQFHDRVLAHFGSAWDDPMPVSLEWLNAPAGEGFVNELVGIIRAELLHDTAAFAVKDPRMCRFVPLWLKALERLETAPLAVIPIRHPAEVAGSLRARNEFPRAKSFLLWLQHTLAAERQTRGIARSFVTYEALLGDWRGESVRMANELGVEWPRERARMEEAGDAFLAPDMRHHRGTASIGDATPLDALVERAYSALTDKRGEAAMRTELDAVWEELAAACRLLGPYVAWEFKALDAAMVEMERLRSREIGLKAERQQFEADIRSDFSRTELEFRKSLAETRHEASSQRMVAERETRLREAAEHSLEHHREMLAEEKERAQTRIAGMAAERDAASARAELMASSTSWRAMQPLRAVAVRLPSSWRTFLRRSVRVGWWAVTPWRTGTRMRVAQALSRRAGGDGLQGQVCSAAARVVRPDPARDPAARTIENAYGDWVKRFDTLSDADREAIGRHVEALEARPKISIVVPVYNTPEPMLREMLGSVERQLYPNWELCLADDASPKPHVAKVLAEFAARDPRIKWMRREQNGHIAAASNSALELATGEFVALLDHDDLLAEQALYEIAVAINQRPDADILFSDEDKIDEKGERYDPYFKPAFSIDLMLGQNMISHLGVYRRALIDDIGGFSLGLEGSQDYDLALRAIAASSPDRVLHVPAVLYHWRQEGKGASFSQANLDQCVAAGRRAIEAQLAIGSFGGKGTVGPAAAASSYNRVRWDLPDPAPLVSVIVPTRDRADLLRNCVDGLLYRTDYPNVELIIVDNGSVEAETHRFFEEISGDERVEVVKFDGPFNYSKINNHAAGLAKGEVLLLLNNDIEVIDGEWLTELVRNAMRADVGVAGAKLLYADERVQHAGVCLGHGRSAFGPGVAGHIGLFRSRSDPGYFANLVLAREAGAVTGACLAIRRSVYEEVGGLDEENLKVAFNDIDLCLKVREKGYRVVWTPFAELFHLESASRGSDLAPEKVARFEAECSFMLNKWGEALAHDPFYPPAFDNEKNDLLLAYPPRLEKPWADYLSTPHKRDGSYETGRRVPNARSPNP